MIKYVSDFEIFTIMFKKLQKWWEREGHPPHLLYKALAGKLEVEEMKGYIVTMQYWNNVMLSSAERVTWNSCFQEETVTPEVVVPEENIEPKGYENGLATSETTPEV